MKHVELLPALCELGGAPVHSWRCEEALSTLTALCASLAVYSDRPIHLSVQCLPPGGATYMQPVLTSDD